MKNLKPVDVAVVGGGWIGLAIAKELTTRTSRSVVVLERGGPRKPADYAVTMDEVDYAIRLRMMQNTAEETITHRHSMRDSAVPVRQYGSFLPGTGVGGAGEHWAGISLRFLPDVFILRSHLVEKHGASRLPEDLAVQDWGVTYDELEPHYWYAEQMMGVSGKAGNLRGRRIEGGNIFEGARSFEYPTPPLKKSYLGTLFEAATQELGYHPFPVPGANLSVPYRNPDGVFRPGCAYCGYCERFGCMVGAKAQPSNTLMPVLEQRNNFALRTGTWVRRIVHRDGRAIGIEYTDAEGEDYFQPADVVVLASFTLNNVRLLYLSGIGVPYDPVKGTGTLGRNLTHQVQNPIRIFLDKPLNAFMGAGSVGVRICDFDGDHGLTGTEGILRFGSLSCHSLGNRPIGAFGVIPEGGATRNWGSEWKASALAWYDRTATISLAAEHLSYRHNYMDLDPTYTDKFGDPLLRFTLDWTRHEQRQRDFCSQLAVQIARAMGARTDPVRPASDRYDVRRYQSTHIQGGAIMGTSPETSVVNRFLQHWYVPNLWVIGASAFPQNPSANPTLTALAVTYWAADAMIDTYFGGPGELL